MEAAATALYRRLGPRYIAVARILYIAAGAAFCLVGVSLFTLFVEAESTLQFLEVLVIAEIGVLVALGWGTAWILDAAGPINDWIRAGRPRHRALEARRTALLLPRRTLVAQGWRAVVAAGIPTTVGVALVFDFGPLEIALFAFSLLVAGSYVTVLFLFLFELELRPVLRDLGRTLPREVESPRFGPDLGPKLLMAIPTTNLAAGGSVGLATTALADGSVSDLGLALLIALAVALSTALLPTALIVGSVLAPVGELAGATGRVRAGELGGRIPVLSSDEMGALADSFNRMLAGLAERETLRDRAERLELESERLERERQADARSAVLLERGRVARELHDVVAHAVSLIVVQAGGARRAAGLDPAGLADSLEVIESSARQAREQMQRMVDVLRKGADQTPAELPGAAEIGALVAGIRGAGVPVELEVNGRVRSLPRGLELACYRIVQEALTNAIKHAPGSPISVVFAYDQQALEIVVENQAPPVPFVGASKPPGGGHGLTGMRERVELFGGELRAGSLPGGGFRIDVAIPIEAVELTG